MKLGLRLYITGNSPFSRTAQEEIQHLVDLHREVTFEVEVIDVVKSPSLAEADEITATPTLLKLSPPPVVRVVGDITNLEEKLGLGNSDRRSGRQ